MTGLCANTRSCPAPATGYPIHSARIRPWRNLVDGFIASAAALAAAQIAPGIRAAMVFCHLSREPGHRVILDAMAAEPLLKLDMALGEGTGAALAWPLIRAAVAMLNDMASFEDAGVSGPA